MKSLLSTISEVNFFHYFVKIIYSWKLVFIYIKLAWAFKKKLSNSCPRFNKCKKKHKWFSQALIYLECLALLSTTEGWYFSHYSKILTMLTNVVITLNTEPILIIQNWNLNKLSIISINRKTYQYLESGHPVLEL